MQDCADGGDTVITPRGHDQSASATAVVIRSNSYRASFPATYSQNWVLVWRRFIGCLGDFNQIRSSSVHLKALRALARTVDNFLAVARNQGVPNPSETTPLSTGPPPVGEGEFSPPIGLFAPWFLATCQLEDRSADFEENMREAFLVLGKIFFRKPPTNDTWEDRVVGEFYAAAKRLLKSDDSMTVACASTTT